MREKLREIKMLALVINERWFIVMNIRMSVVCITLFNNINYFIAANAAHTMLIESNVFLRKLL